MATRRGNAWNRGGGERITMKANRIFIRALHSPPCNEKKIRRDDKEANVFAVEGGMGDGRVVTITKLRAHDSHCFQCRVTTITVYIYIYVSEQFIIIYNIAVKYIIYHTIRLLLYIRRTRIFTLPAIHALKSTKCVLIRPRHGGLVNSRYTSSWNEKLYVISSERTRKRKSGPNFKQIRPTGDKLWTARQRAVTRPPRNDYTRFLARPNVPGELRETF